jgi:hypothetical protein
MHVKWLEDDDGRQTIASSIVYRPSSFSQHIPNVNPARHDSLRHRARIIMAKATKTAATRGDH